VGRIVDGKTTEAACALLYQNWKQQTRIAALPEEMRPTTRAEGYAIQAALEAYTSKPLFGWKIAATSKAGQAHINVDGPLAGRILAERVLPDGATIPLGKTLMRVAEVEFAFRMGKDLSPRTTPYSQEEVLAAVDTLHPAIEIPDSRYEDFARVGAAQLIADDACAHLFMLGEPVRADWRSRDLAAETPVGRIEGGLERTGLGANVLGDPRIALTWLANELSSIGVTLKAGEVVTTGTCLVPLEVKPGDRVIADYHDFGRMEVSFTA
jgi:2-keto-4-pentenoate hydratase